MVKYLIRVIYDGSNYYGFQRLNNYPTIQNEMEKSLSKVYKQKVIVKGAGRTDKNVHALDQGVSFDAPFKMSNTSLISAINRQLPQDIRVISCEEKTADFHARFSVKKKVYEYRINTGIFNPFFVKYYYQPKEKIFIRRLKTAAKIFVGEHDFKNFVSGQHKNTVSHIYNIKITKRKDIISIRITGTSFYKYMVRNIIGAMLDYNKGKINLNGLQNMLDNPTNKRQLTTISPNGLYLTKIYY